MIISLLEMSCFAYDYLRVEERFVLMDHVMIKLANQAPYIDSIKLHKLPSNGLSVKFFRGSN